MQVLVIYQTIISYFKSIRDSFESPHLPMDSDYSYEARQREEERRRHSKTIRILGL
jgi:hypothetical protein